jgi:hypothetical protein
LLDAAWLSAGWCTAATAASACDGKPTDDAIRRAVPNAVAEAIKRNDIKKSSSVCLRPDDAAEGWNKARALCDNSRHGETLHCRVLKVAAFGAARAVLGAGRLRQNDLAVDREIESDTINGQGHSGWQLFVAGQFAVGDGGTHGLFDFTLRSDANHFQKFSDAGVESLFVHRGSPECMIGI